MTKMTNYDDNLFIITERVKLIEKSILLDIDPDLFSSQLSRDLQFIKESLTQIRVQLKSSAHTFKKPENLRNLMLTNITAEKLSISLGDKEYLSNADSTAYAAFFHEEAAHLEEILITESDNPGSAEQVSMEEFEFLLGGSAEEEEL